MKFLIIGDLHGQIPEVHYKSFDAIIAPWIYKKIKQLKFYPRMMG